MTQAIDNKGELMQAFKLPVNGVTEFKNSPIGAVVNFTAAPRDGIYEFICSADCFLAVGSGTAVVPIAGTPGGIPLRVGVAKAYGLASGDIVSAIGAAGFDCYMTKV